VTSTHQFDTSDRYQGYYRNVRWFIEKILAPDKTNLENYTRGRHKLDVKNGHLSQIMEDPLSAGGVSYEAELYTLVTSDQPSGLIFLIGGLGSGKTTAVRYLEQTIADHFAALREQFPCNCQPCTRKPINLDFIDIPRNVKPEVFYRTVLEGIRFGIYNALIDGLLAANGLDAQTADRTDRITLRQLLIANDVAAWADQQHRSLPHPLRSSEECDLGARLLDQKFDQVLLKKLVTQ